MSPQKVITRVRSKQAGREDWLFIAGTPVDITVNTEADLGEVEIDDETNAETYPPGFAERGLASTIDLQTVEDCIGWADRLSGSADDLAAAVVLRYYIRFDAFPDRLGAPDPPPWEETRQRMDREFYDRLGPEDPAETCRHEGFVRGTVRFSAFCRMHHFAIVQRRTCPFED